MFIENVEKVNKYKFRVTADTLVFYVYQSDIRRYCIKEENEFPDERYEALIKETIIPRARKKALDILSRADNYVNDERYAENYINYRGKSKSKRQLKMELAAKGIEGTIIENLMVDDRSDEEALYNLLRKKIKNPKEVDEEKKRKIYVYLYRKGFNTELIASVLRDYLSRT